MKLSVSQGFKVGPFRITLSKSGISVTTGIPGARVGVNSKGEGTVRIGIPGIPGLKYERRKKIT
jgi:hypothetical protein